MIFMIIATCCALLLKKLINSLFFIIVCLSNFIFRFLDVKKQYGNTDQ